MLPFDLFYDYLVDYYEFCEGYSEDWETLLYQKTDDNDFLAYTTCLKLLKAFKQLVVTDVETLEFKELITKSDDDSADGTVTIYTVSEQFGYFAVIQTENISYIPVNVERGPIPSYKPRRRTFNSKAELLLRAKDSIQESSKIPSEYRTVYELMESAARVPLALSSMSVRNNMTRLIFLLEGILLGRQSVESYHWYREWQAFESDRAPFSLFFDWVKQYYQNTNSTMTWSDLIFKNNDDDEEKSYQACHTLLLRFKENVIIETETFLLSQSPHDYLTLYTLANNQGYFGTRHTKGEVELVETINSCGSYKLYATKEEVMSACGYD